LQRYVHRCGQRIARNGNFLAMSVSIDKFQIYTACPEA
jgi:hypothetical protein